MNNPTAFPTNNHNNLVNNQAGMTLRDYFAGQALVGLLANRRCNHKFDDVVDDVFIYADKMLICRERQNED